MSFFSGIVWVFGRLVGIKVLVFLNLSTCGLLSNRRLIAKSSRIGRIWRLLPLEGGEKYELIAGHRRVQAAKELGWREIDATIKDFDDTEALFLALKTNLVREGMSEKEQGVILHKISQESGISGSELARRIGKSREWVNRRIRLALDLNDDVVKALTENRISNSTAEIIAGLARNVQSEFLKYILINDITNPDEVRKAKKRFLNTTIYTIGYEGKEI